MIAKPVNAKPSLYSWYYEMLKEEARSLGFALLLHGSMNRDLDLVLLPWHDLCYDKELTMKNFEVFLNKSLEILGGEILKITNSDNPIDQFSSKPFGRRQYVINLNRGGYFGCEENKYLEDQEYYIDLSVII